MQSPKPTYLVKYSNNQTKLEWTDEKKLFVSRSLKNEFAGTRTGKALKHVNDVMLSANNGNRPKVRDVVLIVTDGSSQDEVKDEAKILRDSGALVSKLPVYNVLYLCILARVLFGRP